MLMSFSYHQRSYTVPMLLLSTMQSSHTWEHKILHKISNIAYWMILVALILLLPLPPWKICLLLCLSQHVLQKSASWCGGCRWVSQGVPVHSRENKKSNHAGILKPISPDLLKKSPSGNTRSISTHEREKKKKDVSTWLEAILDKVLSKML